MATNPRAVKYLLVSALAMSLLLPASANGAQKSSYFKPLKAGRISTVVANTILNGTVPPRTSDGIEGDFYIDTKALLFYGPKKKSRWPAPVSIRGPQGQTGPSGSNGADAKPSANVVATGPRGEQGPAGPRGEQGPQGVPGPGGIAGPAGPQGEQGVAGPAGASGVPGANGAPGSTGPAGSQGPQGAQGPQGPQGAPGAAGSAGANGATGATGPSGVSSVSIVTIPSWMLSTASAGTGAESLQFGSLDAGKSYQFSIILHGNSSALNSYFGVSLIVGPMMDSANYETSVSENLAYVGSAFVHRYTFVITGTTTIGSTNSWLKVTILDGSGATSGSYKMTLSGKALIQTVGQVTQIG